MVILKGFSHRFRHAVFDLILLVTLVSMPILTCQGTPESNHPQQNNLNDVLHQLGGDDLQAYFGFLPTVTVIDSPFPNAYSSPPNRIMITSGLLQCLEDSSQLAFVLAHEIGHLMTDFRQEPTSLIGVSEPSFILIEEEKKADQVAITLLKNSSFSISDSIKAIQSTEKYGNSLGIEISKLFPSLRYRITNLRKLIGPHNQAPSAAF